MIVQETYDRNVALLLLPRELQRYNIDIAALTETGLPDSGTLSERIAGDTFYWQGKPSTEKRESGVGFAIKSDIKLTEFPIGHSDRIMTLRLPIGKNRYLHLISAYAPTMQQPKQQRMLSIRSCLIYCTPSVLATKQSSWVTLMLELAVTTTRGCLFWANTE